MTTDYYAALNLTAGATRDEIHRAYRDLALKYHPDRNGTAGAARIMTVINEAYAVLSEPARRSAYDEGRRAPAGGLDDAILRAARDMLNQPGWTVVGNGVEEFTLRNGSREALVVLAPDLTTPVLMRYARRPAGLTAILALRVEPGAEKRATQLLVIDLLRSRVVTGTFPDPVYQELFRPLFQ
jgi:curved DNA-binding protein CbpA